MKENSTFFIQAVDSFSNNCLSKFGYVQYVDDTWQSSSKRIAFHFSKLEKSCRLHISVSALSGGRHFIELTMVQDEKGKFGNNKTFFLSTYLEEHSASLFPFICMPNEDLEKFTKNYFQNLTAACETYLHEQISGASFEEHDPAPGRV